MRRRKGFTLIEMCVAAGVFSLVIYILMSAMHLAKMYFLSDQLSHALMGTLVLGAELQEDLRQAVRDPDTQTALTLPTSGAFPSIAFYRGVPKSDDFQIVVVPVRWTLKQDKDAEAGYLVRTTFDVDKNDWVQTMFKWAPVPVPGTPGTPPGTNPIGFRVDGDAKSPAYTVLLTVLARAKKFEEAGGGQDRASLQITVAVPLMPDWAGPLFAPVKKLDELPAEQ